MIKGQIIRALHMLMLLHLSMVPPYVTEASAQGVVAGTDHPVVLLDTLTDGRLLLVTRGGEISTFDGSALRRSHSLDVQVYNGARYQNGHLLCTSKGLFFYRVDKSQWVGQLPIQAFDWEYFQGEIYVLSDRSIYRLTADKLLPLDIPMTDPWLYSARQLLEFQGDLYVVTQDGVMVYTGKQLQRRHDATGLSGVIAYNDKLLAATDTGLRVFADSTTKEIVLDGRTFTTPISAICLINQDNFLFSTEDNVYSWSARDYSISKVGPSSDYLTATTDAWAGLWLGGDSGLRRINSPLTGTPPRLTISSIKAGGIVVPFQPTIRLRHDEAAVELYYHAVHLHTQDVSVSYSMDAGLTWTDTDIQRLSLTNIEPGNYDLSLRATADNRQYAYSRPIKLYVAESPYPWWLVALLGLAILALLVALVSLQSARRRIRLAQVSRDKAVAQTAALYQEQKALQLQMNPHFLFNALTSIQGLIASGRVEGANSMLGTYGTFMRKVLDTSRVDWYPLEDEIQLLQDYLTLEQMCHGNSFDFELDCPSELLNDDIKVLPMILQPFVENAIEHGVTKVSRQGKIKIALSTLADHSLLQVIIADNGPGLPDTQPSDHQSVALQVVRDRLSKFDGQYRLESSPRGVSVDVQLPIR